MLSFFLFDTFSSDPQSLKGLIWAYSSIYSSPFSSIRLFLQPQQANSCLPEWELPEQRCMFRTCSTVPPNPWTQVSTCLPQRMFGEVVPWKSLLLSALPPRILSRTSTSGPGFRLDGIEANIVVLFFTSPNLNFYFIIYIYTHICLCYFIIVSTPLFLFRFISPLFFLAYPMMMIYPYVFWFDFICYLGSLHFMSLWSVLAGDSDPVCAGILFMCEACTYECMPLHASNWMVLWICTLLLRYRCIPCYDMYFFRERREKYNVNSFNRWLS